MKFWKGYRDPCKHRADHGCSGSSQETNSGKFQELTRQVISSKCLVTRASTEVNKNDAYSKSLSLDQLPWLK